MTMRFAEVIGDPIAHSKSPLIHNFWLGKLGIKGEYRRCHVRPAELADYLAERRGDPDWRGCNVTIPHKQAALPLMDRLDPLASVVGAVNTVVVEAGGLTGFNTDVRGILDPLSAILPRSNQTKILIDVIGAGGAARAAGAALKDMGEITFHNRTKAKADALADAFSSGADHGYSAELGIFGREPHRSRRDQRSRSVIVNASSLGMSGQPALAFDLDGFPDDTIVFDFVYAPLETELLKAARARGMPTIDGLAMLIGQAGEAFALFFGRAAPRQHDAELRALLSA